MIGPTHVSENLGPGVFRVGEHDGYELFHRIVLCSYGAGLCITRVWDLPHVARQFGAPSSSAAAQDNARIHSKQKGNTYNDNGANDPKAAAALADGDLKAAAPWEGHSEAA